jgi:hypothetical protein
MLIMFQSGHSFIRNYASNHIRMSVKGIPELKPIEKDEERTDKQYFCIGCGGAATLNRLKVLL